MADKAIFLDRDDTIIADPGYINTPEQVKLLAGAGQGLNELRKLGYKLVIVSNQSGIARGIFTENTLAKIHERLKKLLAEEDAYIDRIYYCPYHKQGSIPKYRKDSDERKPRPGMLLRAAEEMNIDLDASWMIGNSYNDISAGKSAGTKTILVKSHTNKPVRNLADPTPDFEAINLKEAANIIKRELACPVEQAEIKQASTAEEKIEPEKTALEPTLPETQHPLAETAETESESQKLNDVEKKLLRETNKTEHLLEEIKLILKSRNRQDAFYEFSTMKLLAGVIQIVVLACLFVAVLYKMSPAEKDAAAFTAIGFAVVLQLMVLTLYIMHNDKQ
ncbi:MAG: HAD family hydrolase [Anaerohalosphaeraceae bacterium]|nr:HAD family hydrolase [Anaerohalosphaeraceae bacterium]